MITSDVSETNTGSISGSIQRPLPPEEPSLLDLIGLLWKHKFLILAVLVFCMLVGALILFQLTPRYTAEARILVGTRATNVVDAENVLERLRPDRIKIQGEVEVLASRTLAEKVVDEIGLIDNPEFNRNLLPPSWLQQSLRWLHEPPAWLDNSPAWFLDSMQWVHATLFGDEPGTALTPEDRERMAYDDTVTTLMEAMVIEPVRVSYVVSVIITSEDAELAAVIANTLSDIYLQEQLAQKFGATEQATDWLNERVSTLRNQVEESEKAVEDYRQSQGLTETSDLSLIEQRIAEVNSLLIAAQATTSEADAKVRRTRELMRTENGVYSAPEVLSSPLIQNLRLQETNLVGEVAQMAQEFGPQHPTMINANAELADLRTKIKEEVGRVVSSLESSLEVARTRENALKNSLEDLKEEASQLIVSQARLRVLEREAAANQALFDVLLERHIETGEQEELFSADAKIISYAKTSSEPSWPDVPAGMGVSFVISGFLSLLTVFLVEQLFERGIRHSGQLKSILGIDSLGAIPIQKKNKVIIDHVLNSPMSIYSESLRMMHTGLLASCMNEHGTRSVLITSALPDEGKTTLCLTLARLIARSGRKTILIDGDLRHGQIAKLLDLSKDYGLMHLLTTSLDDIDKAIQHDPKSELDIITASKSLNIATDIINQQAFSAILAQLKARYDLVLIDTPPVLLVSDTITMANCVDDIVFAIRYGKTPKKIAARGISQLLSCNLSVTGAVLTMAQGTRKGYYSYEYGSYGYNPEPYALHSKYSHYYSG
ncbi:MAG: polysaccharide biosynthesis tyrosine autokinase [Gammaproteobacteria bacterium]|nr:polysaccharide biosynthesis tyrosine autokinase [Gammaproteobacteria bacterium]